MVLRISSLTLALALTASLLSPLAAQDWRGTGRISGQITDRESGEPIVGAQLKLTEIRSGDGPEPIVTDEDGRYSFLGMRAGAWTAHASAEGYVPAEAQVNLATRSTSLNVTLRKLEVVAPEPVEVSPAVPLLTTGNELLAAGDYEGARKNYEEALQYIEPAYQPDILMEITRTYYQQDNLVASIETLEKLLAINPQHVAALKLISNLLVSAGREEEAQAYMNRLPEGETLDAEAYLNVGIALYNDGDLDAALTEFERVVKEYPEAGLGYYYRGLVHVAQQRNPEAAADFKRFIELAPDHPSAQEAREFLSYLEPEQ